jgi:hypothetical protein
VPVAPTTKFINKGQPMQHLYSAAHPEYCLLVNAMLHSCTQNTNKGERVRVVLDVSLLISLYQGKESKEQY